MWKPATFLKAFPEEPIEAVGLVYRGLGLDMTMKGSPKGRRSPTWSLTHLGTGHRVCLIFGQDADVLPIATEIAECGDWIFHDLDGWQNLDPELMDKFQAIIAKHGKKCSKTGGPSDREIARQIATRRAV